MISEQELNDALKTIKDFLVQQQNNKLAENKPCCSKCNKVLPIDRWEQNSCYIELEIGIDCCGLDALFGSKHPVFKHPAIQEGSNAQKLIIKSHTKSEYRLCWSCHRDFVKIVGDFIK